MHTSFIRLSCAMVAIATLSSCGSFATADRPTPEDASAGGPGANGGANVADAGCAADTRSDAANCGACGHSCLGRACRDGLCEPEEIASSLGGPRAIVLGPTDAFVAPGENESVVRVPLTPGPAIALESTKQSVRALALSGGDIYWIGQNLVGVMGSTSKSLDINGGVGLVFRDGRVYASGGASRKVQSLDATLAKPIDHGTTDFDSGLAVDGTHVYWANPLLGIMRASRTSNDATSFAPGEAAKTVAVDDAEVFWTTASEIRKVAKNASPGDTAARTTLAASLASPMSILRDGGFVYWVEATTGAIRRVATTGGSVTAMASMPVPDPFTYTQLIAANATHLYFVSPKEGVVRRVPK